MRTILRVLGGVVVAVTIALWLFTGAHTGWTMTRVTTMTIDPITELEYPETEKRFVAGVEVPVGGILVGLALFSGSFFFRKQSTRTN